MCSSHERPTPLVKREVATTIHQKLIPLGSGEMPKVVTSFWRKEECYYINIATPHTKGIDIQNCLKKLQSADWDSNKTDRVGPVHQS